MHHDPNDGEVAGRRVKNIALGRALGRVGFWRRLWGRGC